MFRLPHPAPLSRDSGAREGITTDSSDSTTLWIGSKEMHHKWRQDFALVGSEA
jgi:hypothetical protein